MLASDAVDVSTVSVYNIGLSCEATFASHALFAPGVYFLYGILDQGR